MTQPTGARICIGVNGIGSGHSTRQLRIARELARRGNAVAILATGRASEIFTPLEFPVYQVVMPSMFGGPRHLQWGGILRAEVPRLARSARTVAAARTAMKQQFGEPDLYISDFEPCSAYFSYLERKPLVTLEQQSKYRFLEFPDLHGFSARVERQRMQLFAPRAQQSFSGSFVPIDAPPRGRTRRRVTITPPIISSDVLRLSAQQRDRGESGLSVAYFLEYFSDRNIHLAKRLGEVFGRCFPERELHVYLPGNVDGITSEYDNVSYRPASRDSFLQDLLRCDNVFASAGYNLISECILLQVPMYLVPAPTYDQVWCAATAEQHGIGTRNDDIREESVRDFVEQCAQGRYAKSVGALRDHVSNDPVPMIVDAIEELVNRKPSPAYEGRTS
ncbi:glycosyltransferase family protein [Dactylosporangium cerinum]|uniref:Glycosyltransferase family protein n=1 Tax=Dactylosporangium cerinum TaxID=1434730 RepID=A0ABV9VPM9_9ACTN